MIHALYPYRWIAIVTVIAFLTGFIGLTVLILLGMGGMLLAERFPDQKMTQWSTFTMILPFLLVYILPFGVNFIVAFAVYGYAIIPRQTQEHQAYTVSAIILLVLALGILPYVLFATIFACWYGYMTLSILRARRTV